MTLYRKTAVTNMVPWHAGFDMKGVTINPLDADNGSPKEGDQIANDPTKEYDRWLVARAYFESNYVVADLDAPAGSGLSDAGKPSEKNPATTKR